MKFNEAKKILKAMKDSNRVAIEMVSIMGTYAINHYKQSFRNEGFTDDVLEKWKPRKRTEKSKLGNRNILTKTGKLRRSLVAKRLGRYAVRISSNLPYATIHNEGGTINKKSREHILSFGGNNKFAKTRTRKQRKSVSYQQKVTIGAHSIKMPKRQFVGYSSKLARKIELRLSREIEKIFK